MPEPSSGGAVMWWASPDAPNPTTSARISRAARHGVLQGFEQQQATALTHDEAGAVGVKRPREASSGSSLRTLKAFMALNPATPKRVMVDSAPPQIMASARPMAISV